MWPFESFETSKACDDRQCEYDLRPRKGGWKTSQNIEIAEPTMFDYKLHDNFCCKKALFHYFYSWSQNLYEGFPTFPKIVHLDKPLSVPSWMISPYLSRCPWFHRRSSQLKRWRPQLAQFCGDLCMTFSSVASLQIPWTSHGNPITKDWKTWDCQNLQFGS